MRRFPLSQANLTVSAPVAGSCAAAATLPLCLPSRHAHSAHASVPPPASQVITEQSAIYAGSEYTRCPRHQFRPYEQRAVQGGVGAVRPRHRR